jgi:hypothetical protein
MATKLCSSCHEPMLDECSSMLSLYFVGCHSTARGEGDIMATKVCSTCLDPMFDGAHNCCRLYLAGCCSPARGKDLTESLLLLENAEDV